MPINRPTPINQRSAAIPPSQTPGAAPMPGTPRCRTCRRFKAKPENTDVYGRPPGSARPKGMPINLLDARHRSINGAPQSDEPGCGDLCGVKRMTSLRITSAPIAARAGTRRHAVALGLPPLAKQSPENTDEAMANLIMDHGSSKAGWCRRWHRQTTATSARKPTRTTGSWYRPGTFVFQAQRIQRGRRPRLVTTNWHRRACRLGAAVGRIW